MNRFVRESLVPLVALACAAAVFFAAALEAGEGAQPQPVPALTSR